MGTCYTVYLQTFKISRKQPFSETVSTVFSFRNSAKCENIAQAGSVVSLMSRRQILDLLDHFYLTYLFFSRIEFIQWTS